MCANMPHLGFFKGDAHIVYMVIRFFVTELQGSGIAADILFLIYDIFF